MLLANFFTSLKRRRPTLFVFILAFSLIQLFCTLLKFEATPALLYGMYSEKIAPDTTFPQLQINVNGATLESYHLNSWQIDYLYSAYRTYATIHNNNGRDVVQDRVETRYRFLANRSFYPWLKEHIYNTATSMVEFPAWYRKVFTRDLNIEVNRVDIYSIAYSLDKSDFSIHQQSPTLLASF